MIRLKVIKRIKTFRSDFIMKFTDPYEPRIQYFRLRFRPFRWWFKVVG